MKVYDLKDCPQMITDIFHEELEIIQRSDLLLKQNYTLDKLKLDDMLSFDILIDNDIDVVCFGGLQKISENIARVSSRHYVSQKYKKFWHNDKRFRPNWQYLVPKQIQHAYDLDYKGLFWSAHIYRKKWMFELTCRNAEKFADVKFTPLPGLYNIFNTAQRVCQIGDYELNFANENIFIEDDYFYKFKDEVKQIIETYPKDNANWDSNHKWKGEWVDNDTGIISGVNMLKHNPDHPLIHYLYDKYFDELHRVIFAKVFKGPIPEHKDEGPDALLNDMHMKIKLDGDWSKFYVKDETHNWKTYFPNEKNVAIFDNVKNVHAVESGSFSLIIPYGKLKREIYERVDTESR
tara:strand:+ start:799 stop:1842 length:1044 start_codon:yes stop_codon:yes gene_type:complete